MKIVYFLLASLVFGCKTKLENNVSVSNVIETEGVNDEIHYRKFLIGDVNNDKIQDTSSVIFKTENEYKDVVIQFSGGIPFINFGPSLGIFIKGTDDVNNDNANEILVFQERMKVGGIIFRFGLFKTANGIKFKRLKHLFPMTKILKTEW